MKSKKLRIYNGKDLFCLDDYRLETILHFFGLPSENFLERTIATFNVSVYGSKDLYFHFKDEGKAKKLKEILLQNNWNNVWRNLIYELSLSPNGIILYYVDNEIGWANNMYWFVTNNNHTIKELGFFTYLSKGSLPRIGNFMMNTNNGNVNTFKEVFTLYNGRMNFEQGAQVIQKNMKSINAVHFKYDIYTKHDNDPKEIRGTPALFRTQQLLPMFDLSYASMIRDIYINHTKGVLANNYESSSFEEEETKREITEEKRVVDSGILTHASSANKEEEGIDYFNIPVDGNASQIVFTRFISTLEMILKNEFIIFSNLTKQAQKSSGESNSENKIEVWGQQNKKKMWEDELNKFIRIIAINNGIELDYDDRVELVILDFDWEQTKNLLLSQLGESGLPAENFLKQYNENFTDKDIKEYKKNQKENNNKFGGGGFNKVDPNNIQKSSNAGAK